MPQVETRSPRAAPRSGKVQPPSVLVLLVVRDGGQWLRQCLRALARQTHRRIGVLAVDNDSTDGSASLLESALGPERVLKSDRNLGFAGGVSRALQSDMARQADYVLFLHDDTALDQEAVAALVEAAERVEGVGVVGPKVVDWEEPRVLREVGLSTDRFGYPYSPLEEGEIDQGQYDRIREVLYVSSCAMLVSREVWNRIGPPDERLSPVQEDLDFCWRARLAGFRVLMTPTALARHREATVRGERPGSISARERYFRERSALASILKNYGLLSLIWILPLYLVQGIVRVGLLAASRRFQDAFQLVAAWGWNVAHLPRTLRLRIRAQAVRRVPDRSVRRSMAPTGIRLRRWGQTAALALLPRHAESAEPVPPGRRALRFARNHPVASAWALALLVAALAYRNLLGASALVGPGLVAFPRSPVDFFRELVSGLRHTGLGGTEAASPALGLLGLGSILTLVNPSLLAKVLLLGLPVVAGATCYRAVRANTEETLPAAVAGACYGLSNVVLWGISEGRIPALVFLAGMPWLVSKLTLPFDPGFGLPIRRWVVGAGVGLSVLASFYPGTVLAAAVIVAAAALTPLRGTRRGRGTALVALAVITATILVFPLAFSFVRDGGAGLSDHGGRASFAALARLWPGRGPGSWPTGFFFPLAAALALGLASRRSARPAFRAAIASVLSIYLAWMAAAGYLPAALSNPVAYLGVAAFGFALLLGLGLADLLRQVGLVSFGHRQVGVGAMALVIGVGLGGQALQAAQGSWAVGRSDRLTPAYGIVGDPTGSLYRVLWLGRADGDAFPTPGGVPDGTVEAGPASVRYAVRNSEGMSALDTGRPAVGPGYDALERALREILAGQTSHGGALLAPFGIRFVVAGPGDLPSQALQRLVLQLDLDPVPAGGLSIFQNSKAAPVDALIRDPDWRQAATNPSLLAVERLVKPDVRVLRQPDGRDAFLGPGAGASSLILLAQQFDPHWRLEGVSSPAPSTRAFGWAVGFAPTARTSAFEVRFHGQATRTIEIALLTALWMVGLWVTRRPSRG